MNWLIYLDLNHILYLRCKMYLIYSANNPVDCFESSEVQTVCT